MNRYTALKHAVKAHAGQTDKCGQPYILHPIAVAEAIQRIFPFEPSSDREIHWAFGGGQEDAEVIWEALGYEWWPSTGDPNQ